MVKKQTNIHEKDSYLDLKMTRKVTLLEILDRVLNKGVIIAGDIVISVADVDLIYLGIKVLISSVETMESMRRAPVTGPMQGPT